MSMNILGFSLLELLITVLAASLILSLGVPSLAATLAKNRQTVEINALFHALYLARKESLRRRQVVSLCPSTNGNSCSGGMDWSAGWIMFENADRDEPPERDAGEALVYAHRATSGVRITANRRGFTSRGVRKRATNGTFVICDPAARIAPKALVVSYTGRPRVASRRRNGAVYACAD